MTRFVSIFHYAILDCDCHPPTGSQHEQTCCEPCNQTS